LSAPSLVAAAGALGEFDRERVRAIAAALPRPARVALSEPGCELHLDRAPIRWDGAAEDGVCWAEQALAAPAPQDRTAAAAIGPGVSGRPAARALHASASGMGPVYFTITDRALYFASTVDALARTAPAPLTIDWDAWAAILTLGYAVGQRTTFREIMRLEAGTRLVPQEDGWRVQEDWGWAAVEPRLEVAEVAPVVLGAMRDAVAGLPEGTLVCQLSGGLDSRLCLGLLLESRRDDIVTVTADQDLGHDGELRAAAELARAVDVPHEAVSRPRATFWRDLELLALRTDYQHVRPPWRVSMLPLMVHAGGTVIDGFGFDTLAAPGDRFLGEATADPAGGERVVEALWVALASRRERRGALGLRHELADAMWASAHAQLVAASKPFAGHPARALLTLYRTRQARGISLEPQAILGTDLPVAAPLATDRVARAALGATLAARRGGALYDALFEQLDPRIRRVRSTRRDSAPPGATLPRPSQTADVAAAMHRCLSEGPLTGLLLPGKLRALSRDPARVPRGLFGAAFLHMWHDRYAARLRTVDPADLMGG
jgi:hypothetical protein